MDREFITPSQTPKIFEIQVRWGFRPYNEQLGGLRILGGLRYSGHTQGAALRPLEYSA